MKRSRRALLGLILVFCLAPAAGCRTAGAADGPRDRRTEKPVIAVTIVPQQTFVEAVCGDLAEVITMVPPGNSPENYEPTAREMERFSDAALYFSIGVPVEQASILPGAGSVKVISLQEAAAAVYPERTFASGGRDPHIWLSPKRVQVMIQTIADEMSLLDPGNEAAYRKNAEEYMQRLEDLDRQITKALEGVRNKKFIVYHPAFGYLADDYGLTMYSLEEEGKEATAQRLQEMTDLAKAEGIKVVFYQEEMDSRQSKAFADELGGKTVQLSPLAADYIENLKQMADTIAEAMR